MCGSSVALTSTGATPTSLTWAGATGAPAPGAIAAQARHVEISGQNRTHYCGAYWGWGFHEDGVASGERVAKALGAAGL